VRSQRGRQGWASRGQPWGGPLRGPQWRHTISVHQWVSSKGFPSSVVTQWASPNWGSRVGYESVVPQGVSQGGTPRGVQQALHSGCPPGLSIRGTQSQDPKVGSKRGSPMWPHKCGPAEWLRQGKQTRVFHKVGPQRGVTDGGPQRGFPAGDLPRESQVR
jgi:hypothetical protein